MDDNKCVSLLVSLDVEHELLSLAPYSIRLLSKTNCVLSSQVLWGVLSPEDRAESGDIRHND